MILALLLACLGRCTERPPEPSAAVALGPAPTRSYLGLGVGTANREEIVAWLEARSFTCEDRLSAESTVERWVCSAGSLPERPQSGKLESFQLIKRVDSTLETLILTRVYSLPDQALADYQTIVGLNQALLGAPARVDAPPLDALIHAESAYGSALWDFQDLRVHMSLLKAGDHDVRLTERWMVRVPGER